MSSEPTLTDARSWMVDHLRDLVPATWDVRPGLALISTISKPTVLVEYRKVEPFDAPIGNVRVTYDVWVMDPHEGIENAETAVDAQMVDLMAALDANSKITWSTATKARVGDTPYLSWKFNVSAIASKPQPQED